MMSSSSIDSNNNDAMKARSDGISRLSKLHKILSISGAPGSNACAEENDLIPFDNNESIEERKNLNPLLYPIAKSKSSGNYICSLRKISTNMATSDYDDSKSSSQQQLLPIVEAGLNSPGVKLLALNSEHLMRRIVCEADYLDKSYLKDVTDLYNEDLGSDEIVSDKGLDVQYELGSVAKLGYGVEKYSLLRVGPFPDLYEHMSYEHKSKNDERSSLIAAEAANSKFVNWGSTFASHAKLLNTYPNRNEECRDVSQICLRLPLYTIGLTTQDYVNVAKYGLIANDDDDMETSMLKLKTMYEKIRDHEAETNVGDTNDKTPEDIAVDDIRYLLDIETLKEDGSDWSSIREQISEIYKSVGNDEMAKFVTL